MKNYLIYDCEIIRCIPSQGARFDEYEYCEGWHDYANMGISVVGWWDSAMGTPLGYWADGYDMPLADCIAHWGDRLIVGFNSRNFDDCLMAANGIQVQTHYDLLEEVRIAAGFEADYQSAPKGYSYSLDAIARANGRAKTGSGALAPQLWQEGKHQEVIDYCLHDVRITYELLMEGLEGRLIDPNTGEPLKLRPLG